MNVYQLLCDIHECRIEGYWRKTESDASDLPWPVPEPGWGEIEFLRKLRIVESESQHVQYRGWSNSRLTGEMNGSREFMRGGWRWPEGLGHYIERGVRPSQDFIDFIELESSPTIPPKKPEPTL